MKLRFLNGTLPHFLTETANPLGTRVIQMSTDCVFSGKQGQYQETDLRDGESFYDRSKALGELNDGFNLTFRNSIIGPDINEGGIGLFNWFMNQQGIIYGYANAIWTGVTTLTLSKAMLAAMEQKLTGLYHLVNNQSISKYELLCLFNRYFKKKNLTILPSKTVQVDKSLINTRNDFFFEVPSYEQMIAETKCWVDAHPELYPRYL